ncbi:hypothetical protein [Streptomyces sp. NBC_01197]|uniref:hypothetical protein n=1 Tax=Streptomyces sp. NBC_01197 TaxID=2903768 RepID=UPI002E10EEF4|nr:hypothetical protein OG452_35075 [Streptomyces sp. NBC_01197]
MNEGTNNTVATTPPVPAWPLYRLLADESGAVTITGPAAPDSTYPTRGAATDAVALTASRLQPPRPVRAEAIDTDGTVWPLIISPDRTIEAGQPVRAKTPRRKKTPPAPAAALPAQQQADQAPPAPVQSNLQRLLAQAAKKQDQAQPQPPVQRPAARARRQSAPVPQQLAEAPREQAPTLLTIQRYADAGDLSRAYQLAQAHDDGVAAIHGPSHSEALDARTLRADLAAALGDNAGAIVLYRDVADRRMRTGNAVVATQIADRAHTLWLQIADIASAATIGVSIVRMRADIAADDRYHHAYQYQAHLQALLAQGHTTLALQNVPTM